MALADLELDSRGGSELEDDTVALLAPAMTSRAARTPGRRAADQQRRPSGPLRIVRARRADAASCIGVERELGAVAVEDDRARAARQT